MENKLQIISGKYRGRKLNLPPNSRPTQQKTRGAVFNMLAEVLADSSRRDSPPFFSFAMEGENQFIVWDAFAGSGAMGIEFISRFGAKRAIFTDIDPEAIKVIKKNIAGIEGAEIVVEKRKAGDIPTQELLGDEIVKPTLSRPRQETTARLIVFIDPPYSEFSVGQELVGALALCLPKGSVIVWETEADANTPNFTGFEVSKDKVYGRARVIIMERI